MCFMKIWLPSFTPNSGGERREVSQEAKITKLALK